jgi:hypothetical protein
MPRLAQLCAVVLCIVVHQQRISRQPAANACPWLCALQVRLCELPQGTGSGSVSKSLLGQHYSRAHKLALDPLCPAHCFYSCGEDGLVRRGEKTNGAGGTRAVVKSVSGRHSSSLASTSVEPKAGTEPTLPCLALRTASLAVREDDGLVHAGLVPAQHLEQGDECLRHVGSGRCCLSGWVHCAESDGTPPTCPDMCALLSTHSTMSDSCLMDIWCCRCCIMTCAVRQACQQSSASCVGCAICYQSYYCAMLSCR